LYVKEAKILKKEQSKKATFDDQISSDRGLFGTEEWTSKLAVNLKKLRDEVDPGLPD
jgi:hypothetical protein